MLKLINVCKSFKNGKNKELVLDNINLDFRKQELVFILGKSGSGKSTLLNIIGGMLEVDSGKIMLDDIDITKFNHNMMCNYRNSMIGYIFQDYHLIEYMSVIDNIKLGQTINNNSNEVDELLKKLGIYNKKRVKVNKLSGGQKQRVAIARAIINNPGIVLCDEPTGALDSVNSIKIMEILKDISRDRLVIVVSHDNSLALKYADRIININDGKILYNEQVDDGKFKEIERKKISLFQIIKLAIKNLSLKKLRTLFTSLAISLGLICMILVLCLSKSFNEDIDKLEHDVVSMFPISIYNGEYEIVDNEVRKANNKIIVKNKDSYVYTNEINNGYLDYIKDIDDIKYINYDYDISMPIISDRYKIMDDSYMKILSKSSFIDNNYDILYGRNIDSIYDIVLKVDSNNNVEEELLDVFDIDSDIEYKDIIGRSVRVLVNDLYYVKRGNYYFINSNNTENYNNSLIELRVVGVVREKEIIDDNSYFYCSNSLIDYILNINSKSKIVVDQLDVDYNVLGIDMGRDDLLSYLGYNTLPKGIDIYVDNIDSKEIVVEKLDYYNDNNNKLVYVDTMKDAIGILKGIINIITIILILFCMISILISSLMIFILTNNRVVERIREIGILRSLGARRKDITRLFNIENIVLGIISSFISCVIVFLLVEPINSLMGILLDDNGLFNIYIDLVIISVIFNIFIVVLSGYIPSYMASKKRIVDSIYGRS